jgi:hypothetical protein
MPVTATAAGAEMAWPRSVPRSAAGTACPQAPLTRNPFAYAASLRDALCHHNSPPRHRRYPVGGAHCMELAALPWRDRRAVPVRAGHVRRRPQITLFLVEDLHVSLTTAGLYYLTNITAPVAGYLIGARSDRSGKAARVLPPMRPGRIPRLVRHGRGEPDVDAVRDQRPRPGFRRRRRIAAARRAPPGSLMVVGPQFCGRHRCRSRRYRDHDRQVAPHRPLCVCRHFGEHALAAPAGRAGIASSHGSPNSPPRPSFKPVGEGSGGAKRQPARGLSGEHSAPVISDSLCRVAGGLRWYPVRAGRRARGLGPSTPRCSGSLCRLRPGRCSAGRARCGAGAGR